MSNKNNIGVRTSIMIPGEYYDWIKRQADEYETSVTSIIKLLIKKAYNDDRAESKTSSSSSSQRLPRSAEQPKMGDHGF